MKTINKDELFGHVREFLKAKGIELQEGSYSRTIQKGCQVLADTINLSQQAVERAREEMQRNLERVRQTIHQKTAPRSRSASPKSEEPASEKPPVIDPKAKSAADSPKPKGKVKPKRTAARRTTRPRRPRPSE